MEEEITAENVILKHWCWYITGVQSSVSICPRENLKID